MNIEHKDGERKGVFLAKEEDRVIGEMTYVWAGREGIIIDHTGVMNDQRGKGVGRQLVKAAVDYARKNELTIMPLCPYAAAEFRRHPDYEDVRKK